MRTSFLTIAIAFMLGGGVNAQERGQGRGQFDPEQIIDRMIQNDDKNGDGRIAKDEANDRIKERFETVDADGDGFITKAEIGQMFQSMRGGQGGAGGQGGGDRGGRGGAGGGFGGERGGPGGFGGRPGGMMRSMPIMVALDKDKNGEISKEEIEGAVAALKTLDKNKDGKISMEEMMPDLSQMGGGRGEDGADGSAGRGGAGGRGGEGRGGGRGGAGGSGGGGES